MQVQQTANTSTMPQQQKILVSSLFCHLSRSTHRMQKQKQKQEIIFSSTRSFRILSLIGHKVKSTCSMTPVKTNFTQHHLPRQLHTTLGNTADKTAIKCKSRASLFNRCRILAHPDAFFPRNLQGSFTIIPNRLT